MSHSFLFILQGVSITLSYTMTSFVLGVLGGAILSVLYHHTRSCRIARTAFHAWISIVRGTPLLLQLSLIYYTLPQWGWTLTLFQAGVLAFSVNSMVYVMEVFRGGIQSLPQGQFDVVRILHIPSWLAWKDIWGPQVIRTVFPALVNESIALLKESAIISMLGEMDIMRRADHMGAQTFDYLTPLLTAGVIYYGLSKIFEQCGRWGEAKLRYHHA